MKKLNIGAGRDIKKSWDNLDNHKRFGANIIHDLRDLPLPIKSKTYDYVLLSHILEHLTDTTNLLNECVRILKIGGKMEIEVPYGDSVWNSIDHKKEFRIVTFLNYLGMEDFEERNFELIVCSLKLKTNQKKFFRKLKVSFYNQLLKINVKIIDYTFLRYFTNFVYINIIFKRIK